MNLAAANDDRDKVTRCNSTGSIYSLASFLKPGMYNDDGSVGTGSKEQAGSPPPKREVVASWALSLKNLLDDTNGVALFLKYCQQLLCEENLLFWQAVEEFKSIQDPAQVETEGKSIYNDFIHSSGKHQVNLNSKTSKAVKAAIKEPFTNQVYDACHNEIFELMKTDSYRKFIQSEVYKEVLCLELDGKRMPWEPDEPVPKSGKKSLFSFLRKDKKKRLPSDEGAADTVAEAEPKEKKFHPRTRSSAAQVRHSGGHL